MRILITGGTGFIGSRLALEARSHQHDSIVTGLTNTDAERRRRRELEAVGVHVHLGKLQDPEFAATLVAQCDAIIHLAAAQHETSVPDSYFRTINVEGTRVLLQAGIRAGVKRFLYGSTIGVYGSASNGTMITEDTPPRPDNIYGRTKLEAEQVVRAHAEQIETTIVRISETYGPGDLRLLKLFKSIGRGLFPVIGAGLNQHHPLHVQDLVRGLLLAAHHPAAVNQTFIFSGPSPITTQTMVADIATAMGRKPPRVHVPLAPVLGVARALEAVARPLRIQPPLHRRRLDFFRKSFWFSTLKAQSLLGFEAIVPFAAGARDTASWYRNHGYLPAPLARTQSAQREAQAPLTAATEIPLETFESEKWALVDILEYTHDAIIVWEMDGAGILYWNRAAEQLYGYSRHEALGRTTHLLLNTQIEGGVDQLEDKLSRYGVWLGQLRHRRRDGSPIIVHARLALMSQRNGRWLVLEVNRDLSERRDNEPELAAPLANLLRPPDGRAAASGS